MSSSANGGCEGDKHGRSVSQSKKFRLCQSIKKPWKMGKPVFTSLYMELCGALHQF